jgi:hypothetical protein
MTVEKMIDVPANHRITLEIPPQVPEGPVILTFTPAAETECPLCAKNNTPNAETAAAIREGRAMMKGEIPAKRFSSLEELLVDLRS